MVSIAKMLGKQGVQNSKKIGSPLAACGRCSASLLGPGKKLDAPDVLSHHSQMITQTSSKSCQMCANDPPDHKEKLQEPCGSNLQKRNLSFFLSFFLSCGIFKCLVDVVRRLYTLLCSLLARVNHEESTSYTRFRMFDCLTTSPGFLPALLREVKWVLLRA